VSDEQPAVGAAGTGHSGDTRPGAIWDAVIGQPDAVRRLRAAAERGPVHAYLFVGPAGSTKLQAARAFAVRLMTGAENADQRDASLILRGEHPDVREVRRSGPRIDADQAKAILHEASLTPSGGPSKVMILEEFHLLAPEGAGRLLKVIEEPPESVTFLILADFVPHDLLTISSRCARVDFRAIGADMIAAQLVTEGVAPAAAMGAARASHGDLERARVLATDPALAERRAAFAEAPHGLDGTGAVAMRTAAHLLGLIDAASEPLTARHAVEVVELDERIKAHGERGSGKKQLDERHRREVRRYRTDELRSGLAAMAATYRDTAINGGTTDVAGCAEAVHRIHRAMEMLDRNPNEKLLVEALLWSLPDAQGVRPTP
jgi:DNA polymerase III subunit delta'